MSFKNLMSSNCNELKNLLVNNQVYKSAIKNLTLAERKIFIAQLHSCKIFIKELPKIYSKRGRPKK